MERAPPRRNNRGYPKKKEKGGGCQKSRSFMQGSTKWLSLPVSNGLFRTLSFFRLGITLFRGSFDYWTAWRGIRLCTFFFIMSVMIVNAFRCLLTSVNVYFHHRPLSAPLVIPRHCVPSSFPWLAFSFCLHNYTKPTLSLWLMNISLSNVFMKSPCQGTNESITLTTVRQYLEISEARRNSTRQMRPTNCCENTITRFFRLLEDCHTSKERVQYAYFDVLKEAHFASIFSTS